jgi:hypothetical protein
MRLRLLVLFASALLALVPAFAFADDDNAGDNDREPVALTTPVAAAPTTSAAPTTNAAPPTADTDENHADRGERAQNGDEATDRGEHADQVVDRAMWCQTHAEACAAAISARTGEIVAWCKAHADKCPTDELKTVLDRLAQCAAQPKVCAAAIEARAAAADAKEDAKDAKDDDKHEDRPAVTAPRIPTPRTTHHSAPSTTEVHTEEQRP